MLAVNDIWLEQAEDAAADQLVLFPNLNLSTPCGYTLHSDLVGARRVGSLEGSGNHYRIHVESETDLFLAACSFDTAANIASAGLLDHLAGDGMRITDQEITTEHRRATGKQGREDKQREESHVCSLLSVCALCLNIIPQLEEIYMLCEVFLNEANSTYSVHCSGVYRVMAPLSHMISTISSP